MIYLTVEVILSLSHVIEVVCVDLFSPRLLLGLSEDERCLCPISSPTKFPVNAYV